MSRMNKVIKKRNKQEIGNTKFGYRERKLTPFPDDQTGYLDTQERQPQNSWC